MLETSAKFVIDLISAGILISVPILFAAIGEIFAERSGVLNLGIEGMMALGAICGFIGAFYTGSLWLGILFGMFAGGLVALLHAFLCITVRSDQIVSGITVWILAEGLTLFLFRTIFGIRTSPPTVEGFKDINIPVLSQIPIIGPILFQQNILVYLALISVPLLTIVLFKTTFGLKIRSVGENPLAANALGINVYRVRYVCVVIGGLMAGLGGAYLSLAHVTMLSEEVVAGRGWIAFAIVIFSKWKPYGALGGALLFGCVDALQIRLQTSGIMFPYQFVVSLPYILTIIVLVMTYGKARAPAALGTPYTKS